MDGQSPVHLVFELLRGHVLHLFQQQCDLLVEVLVDFVQRQIRRGRIGEGLHPDDVEVPAAGLQVAAATMAEQGDVLGGGHWR